MSAPTRLAFLGATLIALAAGCAGPSEGPGQRPRRDYGEPFVKLFREEREMSAMLLVDLSASQNFGTNLQTKRELVTELDRSGNVI